MDWRVVRHAAVNQASHRLLIGDDAGGRSSADAFRVSRSRNGMSLLSY